MKRLLLIALGVLIAIFLIIQLIPINRDNPPVTREVRWDSPQTRALAQRACFDCHSNETVWPWYARVAPMSLVLDNHVREGRGSLNFSEWDQPNLDEFDEIQETIQENKMPPWDYLLMHPAAKLTDTEKAQLIDGLRATFQQDPPIPGGREGGEGREGGDDD